MIQAWFVDCSHPTRNMEIFDREIVCFFRSGRIHTSACAMAGSVAEVESCVNSLCIGICCRSWLSTCCLTRLCTLHSGWHSLLHRPCTLCSINFGFWQPCKDRPVELLHGSPSFLEQSGSLVSVGFHSKQHCYFLGCAGLTWISMSQLWMMSRLKNQLIGW